ncbi:MAG TPA: zf-HC2 domain-containing protein, partial [Thermoanaerobaculia bacterium]|nr:zf-HC2 domain-containing protein [Thermoanaerobaculia bacterium]
MNEHPNVEILSGYHDGELEAAKRRELELHLASCDRCRHRLSGLRQVSLSLGRLGSLEPPADLRTSLERRLGDRKMAKDPIQRLEATLRGLSLQPSLAVVFALIIALAIIMFLFVHGVDRHRRGLPVHLERAPSSEAGSEEHAGVRHLAGRTFVPMAAGRGWSEEGLDGRKVDKRVKTASPAG